MNTTIESEKSGGIGQASQMMNQIMSDTPARPKKGELIAGKVIDIDKSAAFIDLYPFGTGIIYGREFNSVRDIIKKLNIGDEIDAAIVEEENEEGYIELSLKEARQALVWEKAKIALKEKTTLSLPVKDANKGGLILEWQGVQGFVPASQLSTENYPRVEDGDKNAILSELEKLIGKNLHVTVLSIDSKEGKMIFSEKAVGDEEKQEKVEKYTLGDKVEGEITGIVDFGVFIKIEEGLEGLAHISELDWGLVENPRNIFSVGDKVKAEIIEVKDGKISLSVKRLKINPWAEAKKSYSKGSKVEGVVIKYNKYGALASIEEGVSGLVHISEFGGDEEKLKQTLELGKTYPFVITVFEPENQRMALSHLVSQTEEKKEEA